MRTRTRLLLLLAALVPDATLRASPGPQSLAYEKQAILRPNAAQSGERFGSACALDGDTAAVSAPDRALGVLQAAGLVRVHVRQAGAWSEQAQLAPSDVGLEDHFGASLALQGDTLVVGSPDHDPHGVSGAGATYVYTRQSGAWSLTSKLVGDGQQAALFGSSVALDGDTLAVGAPGMDDGSGVPTGAVYVYVRSGLAWVLQRRIDGSVANGAFGSSVALEGDDLLIGAPRYGGTDLGAAYVHTRSGGAWSQQALLFALELLGQPRLGSSVALHGGRALLGAPGADVDGFVDAGAACVFVRAGTSWTLEQVLVAAEPRHDDRLGESVALEADEALCGSPFRQTASGGQEAGIVRVFQGAPTWAQTSVLTSLESQPSGDRFGASLAAQGDTVVVGALLDDGAGAAHVLRLRPLGERFCDASDGSLASCPCGNGGAADSGCDNAQASGGARLSALDQGSPPGSVLLLAERLPAATAPSVVFLRGRLLRAQPVVLGDGLLCVDGPVVRVGSGAASQGSYGRTVQHDGGIGTFLYQAWYRSSPATYCTPAGSNVSNGVVLQW